MDKLPLKFIFIISFILILLNGVIYCDLLRTKRFLTFPRTSPTRVQIIVGIGIPVALDFESVTIGYVFKAEYFLPENASNYLNFIEDPFDPTFRPIMGTGIKGTSIVLRKRSIEEDDDEKNQQIESVENGYDEKLKQKYEKYNVEAVEINKDADNNNINTNNNNNNNNTNNNNNNNTIKRKKLSAFEYANNIEIENEEELNWTTDDRKPKQPQRFDTSRWKLYKGIEALANNKGLVGRACILRTICEASQAPFTYTSGILGELMHIVMSPSTSPDKILSHSDNEFLRAEELGRIGEPCDKIFKECTISLLDKFSGIYSAMENVFKFIG